MRDEGRERGPKKISAAITFGVAALLAACVNPPPFASVADPSNPPLRKATRRVCGPISPPRPKPISPRTSVPKRRRAISCSRIAISRNTTARPCCAAAAGFEPDAVAVQTPLQVGLVDLLLAQRTRCKPSAPMWNRGAITGSRADLERALHGSPSSIGAARPSPAIRGAGRRREWNWRAGGRRRRPKTARAGQQGGGG